MLPQNGQQIRPQHQPHTPSLPSFMPSSPHNPGFDPSSYFNLDPSAAAKQMAALNAASMARIANSRPPPSQPGGGTNSGPYLGGITSINQPVPPIGPSGSHDATNPSSLTGHPNFQMPNNLNLQPPNLASNHSYVDPAMSQPNSAPRNPAQANTSLKQRQRNFLMGLANVMANRNTPLPPALTGIPYPPNYDPTNSPWKIIEPSQTELGSFRLAGRDVDLFRLWGIVFQAGGGAKLNQQNNWNMILPQFDLPEQFHNNGQQSTAAVLAQYYMAILHPFEDAYKRNVQEQQRRAILASRQPGAQVPQAPGSSSGQGRPLQVGSAGGGAQSGFPGQMQGGGTTNMMGLMGQPIAGTHASSSSTNGTSQYSQYPQASQVTPQTPHQRPSSSALNTQQSTPIVPQGLHPTSSLESMPGTTTMLQSNGQTEKNVLDQDMQGLKRKLDSEEADIKRVRQKTAGSEPPESTSSATAPGIDRSSLPPPNISGTSNSQTPVSMPAPPRARPQPSRRKVEYIPLAREVDTYGGRDLHLIDEELARLPQRRPMRDINEWGTVDIEALTMSIRSRLSTELSYALTTFTLLSTMRGQTQGSGFPIFQCVDLLDEVLDLLEDVAFDDVEDTAEPFNPEDDPHITTHRDLVNIVYEEETQPFAGLVLRQGSKDPDLGPRQRPGNIILAVINIIRNLSTIPDNLTFIAQHERLLDLVLRVCGVAQTDDGCTPCAASRILSLADLVTIRKDTLYVLTNIAGLIQFSSASPPSLTTLRVATRAFELVASYLVDPAEAVSPLACVQQTGIPVNGHLKPPLLPDIALEVFTRLSQADANRQVFSKVIPQALIWRLFKALVHRLPVVDADFQLVTRELWLSYLEKNIMAIYSLAFLAPPELKLRVKTDRSLGFTKVMLRMIQKFLMNPNPDGRMWFLVSARRAIETMKVVDDGEDSFDTSKSTVPTMSFGMGYGEVGENGMEKGTGLLGGHRDLTWDLLMLREVDEVMFSELESLARVA